MAVTLRLKKPLYEWRRVPGEWHNDLHLRHDVEEWLKDSRVGYRTYTSQEKEDDGRTYLYFYLKIEDANVAMQFKLTWI